MWLSICREVQTICIWSSWCHCQPIVSFSSKIQKGSAFLVPAYPGYPGKRPLNGCSSSSSSSYIDDSAVRLSKTQTYSNYSPSSACKRAVEIHVVIVTVVCMWLTAWSDGTLHLSVPGLLSAVVDCWWRSTQSPPGSGRVHSRCFYHSYATGDQSAVCHWLWG